MSAKETMKFKDMPTVVKISEVPTGVHVLRINLPFTVRHLADKGVQKAMIISNTTKSIATFLKEDLLEINEFREKMKQRLEDLHPSLRKRISVAVATRLNFGGPNEMAFVTDIPRLQEDLSELGVSDLPLTAFAIPLQKPKPEWVTFIKRRGAFICIQIGSKMFYDMTEQELQNLIIENQILRDLNCFVCETVEKIGKWLSCKVPTTE